MTPQTEPTTSNRRLGWMSRKVIHLIELRMQEAAIRLRVAFRVEMLGAGSDSL